MATPDEIETFRKMELAAYGETVRFSPEQGVTLLRVIKIMAALDALGWLGKGAAYVLAWAAGMYGSWAVFGGFFVGLFTKK